MQFKGEKKFTLPTKYLHPGAFTRGGGKIKLWLMTPFLAWVVFVERGLKKIIEEGVLYKGKGEGRMKKGGGKGVA